MKTHSSILAVLTAFSTGQATAGEVFLPNFFISGTPARASEVNENFNIIKNAVNDNHSRITTNTGQITTNTGVLNTLSSVITVSPSGNTVRIRTPTTDNNGNLEVSGGSTALIVANGRNSVGQFIGQSAGGTLTVPTAVQNGSPLAWFGARGYTGTGFSASRGAMIMNASENWSNSAHGTRITFGTTTNGTTSRSERMRITHDGRVGIGTTTPTRGKLEVSGAVTTNFTNQLGYGDSNGFRATPIAATPVAVSLYATNAIAGAVYVAFSDGRTKRIEGRSDATRDLATLARIEVTDYLHIDTVSKGLGKRKKVIAQQVEKVYPQAVSRSTDVVPDIYQKAPIENGWVQLATDLQKGERVRLIGPNKEGIYEVLAVEQGRFRTDFAADGDEVFVYGREVPDFRNVDYNAIAMLNVSATQELHRRLETQTAEIAKLRAENKALIQLLSTLDARDKAREARLDRLENALENSHRAQFVKAVKNPM